MTTPPQSPIPSGGKQEQREGLAFGIMGSLKLKFRLLHDRRVSGWMKFLFVSGVILVVSPLDIAVGPIDDIVILAFLANWEDLLPGWLVNEHRLRLEAENRGENVVTQPLAPRPPPTPPPAPIRSSPPPSPPIATIATDSPRFIVVIHRVEDVSIFHLTRGTREAIEGNTDLKKAIGRYRIKWDSDTFEVGTKREAQVLSAMLQHLPGLRIQSPSK